MTEEREDVHTEDAEPAANPVAIRTGEAARMLGPAAARLGLRMERQDVRRLCDQGKLSWDQLSSRGWRLVSVASVHKLIEDWTERADRAAHPEVPGNPDTE